MRPIQKVLNATRRDSSVAESVPLEGKSLPSMFRQILAISSEKARGVIPSNGTIRPTVIDKDLANRINRIRLRDQDYNIIEAVDFFIQLLYTLNLWS